MLVEKPILSRIKTYVTLIFKSTQAVLVASIRCLIQITEVAQFGAHKATVPLSTGFEKEASGIKLPGKNTGRLYA